MDQEGYLGEAEEDWGWRRGLPNESRRVPLARDWRGEAAAEDGAVVVVVAAANAIASAGSSPLPDSPRSLLLSNSQGKPEAVGCFSETNLI